MILLGEFILLDEFAGKDLPGLVTRCSLVDGTPPTRTKNTIVIDSPHIATVSHGKL